MPLFFGIFLFIVYFSFVFFVSWVIGREKRIGVFVSLIVCLLTSPFFGYFIVSASADKNPKGCNWCGNAYNEAVFCGLCGKNETGEVRPGYVPKHNQSL